MGPLWLLVSLLIALLFLFVFIFWLFYTGIGTGWEFGALFSPEQFSFVSNSPIFYATLILVGLLIMLSLMIIWLK